MLKFDYICLDCGTPQNSEHSGEDGICKCGADNFLECGDPIITPDGFKGCIEYITTGTHPIKILSKEFNYSVNEIVLDSYRYDDLVFSNRL